MCIEQDFIRIEKTYDSLTTTMKAGIKNGMFRDLLVIDLIGNCLEIENALKLHGLGFLWGYNCFFNQKVKIKLIPKGEPYSISFQEVKKRAIKTLKANKGFWESGGNFNEILHGVEQAKNISEIIEIIPC